MNTQHVWRNTEDNSPIPVPSNPLIGRADDVAAACRLLCQNNVWLLTLTGAGGIGKTRLAFEIAVQTQAFFSHGVCFVSLAAIDDPELVAPTIAQSLGVVEESGTQPLVQRLEEELRERHLLLLLDNFERVLAAAPLLSRLLTIAPRLKILVTSRSILHLSLEHEFPVLPLALPNSKRLPSRVALMQCAAVELFVRRAQAVDATFMLNQSNAAAIAEICVRLDGLPLALELAAARSKLLPPSALLSRLGNRLALLTGGPRDVPDRQRTLRATIDWSYALLDAGEQRVFSQLAVFVGGCTLEAAEAVCDVGSAMLDVAWINKNETIQHPHSKIEHILDGLAALVDHSLLQQREHANEERLVMLETIHEYALEQFAASAQVEELYQRHAAYYLELAELAVEGVWGSAQALWLERLERDHDNMRAALRRALERGDARTALRLSGSLWHFWHVRGYFSEGLNWLEQALAVARDPARAASQDPLLLAQAIRGIGTLAAARGEYLRANTSLAEALGLYRTHSDQAGVARTLNILGVIARRHGELDRAEALFEESLSLLRRLGHRVTSARVLLSLGLVAFQRGNYAAASMLYEESLGLCRGHNDQKGIAMGLMQLGDVALHQAAYDQAHACYIESLTLVHSLGDKVEIAFCLEGLGKVAGAQGELVRAARLWGAAEQLRVDMGVPLPPVVREAYSHHVNAVRAVLDAPTFALAWAAGRALALDEAITEAWASE